MARLYVKKLFCFVEDKFIWTTDGAFICRHINCQNQAVCFKNLQRLFRKTRLDWVPCPPVLVSLKLFGIHSFEIHCQALQPVGLIASHWTSFWIQFLFNLARHMEWKNLGRTAAHRLWRLQTHCNRYASSTVNRAADANLTGREFQVDFCSISLQPLISSLLKFKFCLILHTIVYRPQNC